MAMRGADHYARSWYSSLRLNQLPRFVDHGRRNGDKITRNQRGLLVSLPASQGPALEAEFAARRLFIRRIGYVEEGSGVVVE